MNTSIGAFLILMAATAAPEGLPQGELTEIRISLPKVAFRGWVVRDVRIEALGPDGQVLTDFDGIVMIRGLSSSTDPKVEGSELTFRLDGGVLTLEAIYVTSTEVRVRSGDIDGTVSVRIIPGILAILPALLAIGLAIVTREVLLSLFAGVWLGATILLHYNPAAGFLSSLDTYLVDALADRDHAMIVLFTLTLSGMVGLMARAGGTRGLAEIFARYARTARSGQVATFLLGLVIFFDDYANTLLVGNTLRPLTDRLKISREKLAYIVDSTAAPVAGLALISTWVGFEVGVIGEALGTASEALGQNGPGPADAFAIFIDTIPYRFYSILAILFVFLVAWTGRDFGAMRRAEERARREGKVLSDTATPLLDRAVTDLEAGSDTKPRWANAAVPVLVVILATLAGLAWTGAPKVTAEDRADGWIAVVRATVAGSDAFKVLFWGAGLGSLAAAMMALGTRSLGLKDTIAAWMTGVRAMILAIAILILAWSIGSICEDLRTAHFVIGLTESWLTPVLLPSVVFLAAAGISFATGTSYGTMGILMPIAVPLAAVIGSGERHLLLASIGSVLAGAIFGDHCSPISDTTVLSSVASASDHIDHVRTQIPYALTVAGAALFLGCLPIGFGLSPWLGLALCAAALYILLAVLGKQTGHT